MNKLAQLRADRAAKLKQSQDILDLAAKEERDPTEDEFKQIEGLHSEADQLAVEIKAEERKQAILDRQAQAMKQLQTAAAPRSVQPTATTTANTTTANTTTGTTINVDVDDGTAALLSGLYDNSLDHPYFGFDNFGQMVVAVKNWETGNKDERLQVMGAAAGLNEGIDDEGGFLMPREQSKTIWDGVNSRPDSLLAETDQWTVTGKSLEIPANAETSRATGSRYGGVRGYWVDVGGAPTTSNPTFRQLKLEPSRLGCLVHVTNDLMAGASANIARYVTMACTDEIVFLTSDSIIDGTGAGQPLGLLAAGCTLSVAKENGQQASTIVAENIDKMYARLHPRARAGARWKVNVDTFPQLQALKHVIGTGGQPLFRPAGSIAGTPNATLLGLPIDEIEACKTLGTVGDIMLTNLGFYASGTRGNIEGATSIHFRFDTDEQSFRFLFRVDGQPYLASAITPFNGTNTLSPFISLATRS